MENEVSYIAKRYSKGKFSVDKSWQRLGIGPSARWRILRMAAAIASAAVLSAVAAIVYHQYNQPDTPVAEQPAPPMKPEKAVKTIDFEDTPLSTVITKIREVYGVEVTGVPDNAADYHLSLHYEGNAMELIETINEILGTKMSVKE